MNINKIFCAVVLTLAVAACSKVAIETPAVTPEDNRPNILFIVADDLGFTDIGAFGSEISTPTLDKFALGGLRIANMHAGPACQPTRAMLMASTGYQRAVETRPRLANGERDNLLSRDWAIIPELLQDAGYATYITGKWDLGRDKQYTAATRGFDRSFVQLNGSSSFFREYFFDPLDLGFEDDGVNVNIEDLDEDFYVTDHYTDKMLEYLRANEEGKPWFAYMPYTAPHWPLQLPDEWLDRNLGKYEMGYDKLRTQRFESAMKAGVLPKNSSLENYTSLTKPWDSLSANEKRKYARAQEIFAGMIEYMDMSIARVMTYLEQSGQLDNTVVIFTADHGASQGEYGVGTGIVGGPKIPAGIDNSFENFGRMGSFIDHGRGFGEAATAPFKYFKGALNEGGLRAAGFIYYPKKVKAGGVTQAYMTMMDFLPTFMEIAGTEHPGAGTFNGREIKKIDGASAWSHLTGQTDSVHDSSYAAGWSGSSGATVSGALTRGDYKLINTKPPGQSGSTDWRLYNMSEDPGEHNNIADQHPEIVAEMLNEWETNWR